MIPRLRLGVFLVAAVFLGAMLLWAFHALPSFGHYPGPYGDQVVPRAVSDRHADNAVTTVVMDIRAVDTAGEELILFAATVGVLMLLRKLHDERGDNPPAATEDAEWVGPSTPVAVVTAALIGPAALLGLYVVAHGQLTPGGGFQGGVMLATPSLLLLLAGRRRRFDELHQPFRWELAQAIAVVGFLAFGFAGMVFSHAFLANFLPLGVIGTVFSAGTITVLNLVAGVGVSTAVVLLTVIFLRQLGVRET
ncbi:MAG TPA: MnhB domain-containing protein [Acidimicrobiales bacterium]|nr:MnhB domain-containing protein [Acidimicrobiales bacterium]